MAQPPGFVNNDHPTHVCELRKSIYSLKQAPRAWYHKLCQFLVTFGFINSHVDASLFVLNTGRIMMYLLVYVDDVIIIGDNDATI